MIAPKQLRKPSNWQDFESLCKKLWGEIWNCPEIQKHGRTGQAQLGVDVFGIPENQSQYYGIQCKGKDENYGGQFTKGEIIKEVDNAKKFKPPLKKFYLATTAPNDAKIQKVAMELNVKHIKEGLFEVHLFCWETIADLIEENKGTADWYLSSNKYKTEKSAKLTFTNDSITACINPSFLETRIKYLLKKQDNRNMNQDLGIGGIDLASLLSQMGKPTVKPSPLSVVNSYQRKINRSFIPVKIKIKNDGISSITNFQVDLNFSGSIDKLAKTNITGGLGVNLNPIGDVLFNEDSTNCKIVPVKNTLVGDEPYISDAIYVKSKPEKSEITISWKLISDEYKAEGKLLLISEPEIKLTFREIEVSDPQKDGVVDVKIQDNIIDYSK